MLTRELREVPLGGGTYNYHVFQILLKLMKIYNEEFFLYREI